MQLNLIEVTQNCVDSVVALFSKTLLSLDDTNKITISMCLHVATQWHLWQLVTTHFSSIGPEGIGK